LKSQVIQKLHHGVILIRKVTWGYISEINFIEVSLDTHSTDPSSAFVQVSHIFTYLHIRGEVRSASLFPRKTRNLGHIREGKWPDERERVEEGPASHITPRVKLLRYISAKMGPAFSFSIFLKRGLRCSFFPSCPSLVDISASFVPPSRDGSSGDDSREKWTSLFEQSLRPLPINDR